MTRAIPIRSLALCCAAACLAQSAFAAQLSLPLYSVAYTASYRFGFLTFSADTDTTMTWDDQAGEYQYNTNFEARGLASLRFPGKANDQGRFKLDCRGIVPLENRRDDGSDKLDEDVATQFDVDDHLATVHYQGKELKFDLPPGTVDPQILTLAVMLDLQQGLTLGTYTALDRDKIKTYPFKMVGKEQLDTKVGKVSTLVLQEGTDTSTRTRKVWVAPELDYLPVKIEYRRKGKVQATMTIDQLARTGQGPTVECATPASNARADAK